MSVFPPNLCFLVPATIAASFSVLAYPRPLHGDCSGDAFRAHFRLAGGELRRDGSRCHGTGLAEVPVTVNHFRKPPKSR